MDAVPALDDCAISARLCLGNGATDVVVKDCIDIAGTTTSMGTRAHANRQPAETNATVVDRLLANDTTIVGKANMHPLAYGVTGFNEWLGTPVNPNYPDLIPGGSSSGSAVAVAAGLADIGIGTDTGGSVRMPAACCGIVGLKPTFGRVDRTGVHPSHSSLDCVGPLARSLAEIEMAMTWIARGFQKTSCAAARIALLDVSSSDEIRAATHQFLQALPLEIEMVALPLMEEAHLAGLTIIAAETWRASGALAHSPDLQADVRLRLERAAEVTDKEVIEAELLRQAFTSQVDKLLTRYSTLMLPTLPVRVPLLDEARDPAAIVPLTELLRPFNLSGHPAISLPIGEAGGRPVSLQLVGSKGGDAALCALARRLETFTKGEE